MNRTTDKPKNSPTVERLSATSRSEGVSDSRRREISFLRDSVTDRNVNLNSRTEELSVHHSRMKETAFSTESMRAENTNRQSHSTPRDSFHQDKNRYHQRFRQEALTEEANTKPSKLSFADDELSFQDAANRKFEKAQARTERFENRLHKAERKLPSRRRMKVALIADSDSGEVKKRLRFEKEAKTKVEHLKGPAALRPVKGAANLAGGYVHRKIYQNEHENIGVQAAHRTELVGEAVLRYTYRARKLAPYNKVKRLQNRTINAQAKAAYQKALAENPAIKKGIAKLMYKQKLKRKYAKAAREAQKTGKRAKDTAVTTEKIVKIIAQSIKNHPVVWLVTVLLLLVILFIASTVTSCSGISFGSVGLFATSSYLADDDVISQAELTYTEWETDLQIEIDNIESTHPGYDEYRYQINAIEHDPYVLMGYLTAVYGDFDTATAESAMRGLFNSQYRLTLTEEIEKRKRSESQTDPTTHKQTSTEVEYEYKILNVKLNATPLENVVVSRMNKEQKEICELLMTTKGSRQYVENVFGDTNWLPFVTSYYGYRVHPISGGKNYHTGVDIGMSQGTEILAGHDGVITTAGMSGGYGLCVVIEGETSDGKSLLTRYGHCTELLVSVGDTVSAGDVIAKVGSTGNSTGPHLHLEVIVNGNYLNPLYFAETGDETEKHLPTVTGGGNNYTHYTVPPEALSDARFKAILTEAEKYLGYPYVWGGSSPETSFDCSGYVSWVLNHSGWDIGRLGVWGLEALCTPVSPEEAKPGDLVFFERTYDTTGTSHVGIYVGDGMMIHCGDPISYANINTSYWQEHFYGFGRLP